ncbi:hypothetical protein [Desulfovibrio sp. JC010]|uniref:hypothetical protein n=1 Tax=Desulfovibrio sp. JC010 TaxID=2593641 RepID=UPI0013D03318|nr:hypothetical protein [Desulfovibrio sp. JC010]NDV27733.1 hypothetical protein [Desulfovibrio sp. JC010]
MLMLFVNLVIVLAAIAACVWGCFNPKINKKSFKLLFFLTGLVLDVVAVFAWAFSGMWPWVNWVLLVQVVGLVLWARFGSRHCGTHNYDAYDPVILAIVIAAIDLISWLSYAVWG